jgi:asparagine synthetase B (glutamine-hydrolysing)
MCGILFTNKEILNFDYVIQFLQKRGPDATSIKKINNYTFVHTLLSMTGPITEQPFVNNNIICMFNGEIYNYEEFGNYQSDGECLIPLYEKYGDNFINKLDGEFAIVLMDLNNNKLIVSTDIFGTRPLWMGFDENNTFGISTYKSCLDRLELNSFQILSNTTYIFDLDKLKVIEEKRVHTFDLNQYKTNFDDWNKAFENSIKKRTKYAKCGIFIGMSGGYDSGAIACELNKQNIEFTAYSITNVEDKNIMKQRSEIIKDTNIFDINRDEFLQAREYLKKNSEEYCLNIDNGELNNYYNLINKPNYNKNEVEQILDVVKFRKTGQLLTDDNGAIGCSHICSLAIKNNQKIYLSGSGADEIFSDYGFNKVKFYSHSSIGGYFPEDLNLVFPWKNFFGNTQRAYLMKEEYVAGSYGIEGRYPFLDKYVVQEFLWLSSNLKNKNYKSPLDNYLTINNFPFEKNQKTGFGCGHAGPSNNDINYKTLSYKEINESRNKKVTDFHNSMLVDFKNYNKKSYENHYILDKKLIKHINKNLYYYPISINEVGLKYKDNCHFYLLENNEKIGRNETNISNISELGKGLYCFLTSNCLYFSSSDNSNPITNNKQYSIDNII